MQAFQFAQKIISTLSLDPLLPGYSAITFALADKTQGKLGGYVDSSGNLVIGGLTTSALTTLGSGGNFDFSGSSGNLKAPGGGWCVSVGGTTALAAAGSNQGGAAALSTKTFQLVSSTNSASGLVLPASAGLTGLTLTLINTSGTAAKLYPDAGGTINNGSASAAVTLPASTGLRAVCFHGASGGGTWWVEQLNTL